MATLMGYEEASLPTKMTIRQVHRLLREHGLDMVDLANDAEGNTDESDYAAELLWAMTKDDAKLVPCQLVAAYLGY